VTRALAPVFRSPMSRRDATRLAGVLKALAEPTRLQLLALLADGEASGVQLLTRLDRVSQPTVSHHLTILNAAGLIESRRDGQSVRHSLSTTGMAAVADALRPAGDR